jgi:hypothetical protein
VNHPTVEAFGRCKQCTKPFCSACEVAGPTGSFCSEACKKKHETFVQRAAKLDDMQRDTSFFGKLWIRVRKVLAFVIIALILALAVHFMGVTVPWLSDILNRYI